MELPWWLRQIIIHQPMQETRVQYLGQKDNLEKEMVTRCNIFIWEIPWTEEPGGLQTQPSDSTTAAILQTWLLWVCVWVIQLCLTLCDPTGYSPPGSSIHGILHPGMNTSVGCHSLGGSSQTRDRTQVSCIAGICFTISATKEAPFRNMINGLVCTCL